ncbi:MAG: hypothetical protein RLY78_2447, partial [Pseudomonadota bacterium]
MTDAPKLTARQQQILDLVREAIERTGAPPTRAEIAATLGYRSANAAEEHLQALARKGVIELVGGTSRGIRLPQPTLARINDAREAKARTRPAPAARTLPAAPPAVLASLSLPLVGRVAAGHPILAEQHIEEHYAVSPALFSGTPDYLLRVRGLSMRDAGILDGDLLAVRRLPTARNGQIVVARLGEEVTVKRWEQQGRRLRL